MQMNIGGFIPDNRIFLAPMAGITDMPFRVLCKAEGAGLTYTEMVSAKALHYRDETTCRLLRIHASEAPCAVQIFGHEPDMIAEACALLSERKDIALIDINMGCPAPKIVNNGDGSALMKKPELIRQIVRAAVAASRKPVTVKTRKGWDEESVNVLEIADIVASEGAAAITVHGRTRNQMYAGTADWEIIREVKHRMPIPVIGNGDVRNRVDAERMFAETGCDAIMIGRAAHGNPWIFREMGGAGASGPTPNEWLELILRHYEWMIEEKGNHTAICEMRKHTSAYLHGMPGAARTRAAVFATDSMDEIRRLLQEMMAQKPCFAVNPVDKVREC